MTTSRRSTSFEGTNDGPIPDMGIAKPTGKKVAIPTLTIVKIDGGKVTHAWIFYQSLAMMMQLGVHCAAAAAHRDELVAARAQRRHEQLAPRRR